MQMIIGGILLGTITVISVKSLLRFVGKYDKESAIVPSVSKKWLFFFFMCGFCSFQNGFFKSFAAFIACSYIAFEAYVDHHTRQVYSLPSYIVFIVGILCMCGSKGDRSMMTVLVFAGIVLGCYVLRAYSMGDMEILIALSPYIVYPINNLTVKEKIFVLSFFLVLSFFVSVLLSIDLKHMRIKKVNAMAPAIAVSFCTVMGLYKFIS